MLDFQIKAPSISVTYHNKRSVSKVIVTYFHPQLHKSIQANHNLKTTNTRVIDGVSHLAAAAHSTCPRAQTFLSPKTQVWSIFTDKHEQQCGHTKIQAEAAKIVCVRGGITLLLLWAALIYPVLKNKSILLLLFFNSLFNLIKEHVILQII